MSFSWRASKLAHEPLYFEELPLERYGQSVCPALQPAISTAHFFATLPILPYKMALDHPHECIYTLGFQRPGDCAPAIRGRLPWEADAAAVEAATVVGLAVLLP